MESTFSCVLIEDPRLMVTDTVQFAVVKGAQNITQSQVVANSTSISQILFNVPVPSENVIIDRKMIISTTVSVIITVSNVAAGDFVLNIGNTDGLGVFPLNSLFSTLSATINNCSVSCNIQDILAPLLLLNEKEELYKWHGTSPCLPDNYYLSYDPLNVTRYGENNRRTTNTINNNVLAAYSQNGLNTDFVSRGSFPYSISQVVNTTTNTNYTGTNAWNEVLSATDPGTFQVYLSVNLAEPLLLSPFLFGDSKASSAGFYGIQNFSVQANIGNANKFWSTANPYLSIALNPNQTFQNTKLIMTYLTPQPSQLLKPRNVVPFYCLPRYISTVNSLTTIPPSVWNPSTSNGSIYPCITTTPTTLISSNLQLNMIPDLLIIAIRPVFSQQGPNCSNSFLTITNISLNFSNSAGLLSSFSQYDLWRMSVKNGSQQPWSDFSGFSMITNAQGTFPTPTCGSLLVLRFGEDIQINDWLSCSSLGNFNLQFQISVVNQSLTYQTAIGANIPAGTVIGFPGNQAAGQPNNGIVSPEILTICMDSGVFVSSMGTSSVYTGLLSKQNVLDASQQAPYTRHDVERLVGGSIHDKLLSSIGHIMHKKGHHHAHKHHHKEMSGGGLGASTSGGSMHHHHHHSKIHKHIK